MPSVKGKMNQLYSTTFMPAVSLCGEGNKLKLEKNWLSGHFLKPIYSLQVFQFLFLKSRFSFPIFQAYLCILPVPMSIHVNKVPRFLIKTMCIHSVPSDFDL